MPGMYASRTIFFLFILPLFSEMSKSLYFNPFFRATVLEETMVHCEAEGAEGIYYEQFRSRKWRRT
jgi:hypothetical protein